MGFALHLAWAHQCYIASILRPHPRPVESPRGRPGPAATETREAGELRHHGSVRLVIEAGPYMGAGQDDVAASLHKRFKTLGDERQYSRAITSLLSLSNVAPASFLKFSRRSKFISCRCHNRDSTDDLPP